MDYNRENMIDLNEENIRSIFSDCIATEQTPADDIISTNFIASDIQTPIPNIQLSRSTVNKNYLKLLYLTGQLDNVHKRNLAFRINDGFKKYDGSYWTQDKMAVFSLYYLSSVTNVLPYFKASPSLKTFVSFLNENPLLEATLSPNDPNFEEWAKSHTAKTKKKSGGQEPADD